MAPWAVANTSTTVVSERNPYQGNFMTAALQFEALHRSGEELMARASRLAGGLYALGLREGDMVAVLLRNCEQFVDIVHAARVAGIYYCPIN